MGNSICNSEREQSRIQGQRYSQTFNQQSSYILSSQLENENKRQKKKKKGKIQKNNEDPIQLKEISDNNNNQKLESRVSFQSVEILQRDSSKNPYQNQQFLQSELYHNKFGKQNDLEPIQEFKCSQELENNKQKNETFGGNTLDLVEKSLIQDYQEIQNVNTNNQIMNDFQCIDMTDRNIYQYYMINMENNLNGFQQIINNEDEEYKLQVYAKTYLNQNQNRVIEIKGEYFLPGFVFDIIELFEDFNKIQELDKKIVCYEKQLLQSYFSQYNIPQNEENERIMAKIQEKLDKLENENQKIVGQINETQLIKKIVQLIMFSVPREFNYIRKIKCMDILKGIVTESCESVLHESQYNRDSDTGQKNYQEQYLQQKQQNLENQQQNNENSNSSQYRNTSNLQENVQGQIIKQCQTYIPAHLLYGEKLKGFVLVRFYSEIDYKAYIEEQLYINTNCQEIKNQVERWYQHLKGKNLQENKNTSNLCENQEEFQQQNQENQENLNQQ